MTTHQSKNTVYLSLGSNIGDRVKYLSSATDELESRPSITVIKESKIYETEPWPKDSKNDLFLNQVIKIETSLPPKKLLNLCRKIETQLGRKTKSDYKPRTIDVDILLFGDVILRTSDLQIPHKHINNRQFVLIPLLEVEPGVKDPISGEKYELILKNIKDEHKVEAYL